MSGAALVRQSMQLQHRLEQAQLVVGGAGRVGVGGRGVLLQAGEDRGQLLPAPGAQVLQRRMTLADQRAQRAEQRRVGQLAVGLLHPIAPQDQGPVRAVVAARRQPVLELADQAGLADARVTAEQDERGSAVAGLPDGELQLGQLADPSDEVVAGQPGWHVRSIA